MEDFGLIVSSFRAQYGVRLSREASGMSWDEFTDLLSGLGPDTPLGRVVAIRSEEDPEMLKLMSPEQLALRSAWLSRRAGERSPEECEGFLRAIQSALKSMAGGGIDA